MISHRPYRICGEFGCGKLTKEKYCEAHVHREDEKRREGYRNYNKYVRDKELHSFYKTNNWRRVREYVLARDNNLCVVCWQDNRMTVAELVHHVHILELYPELALSPDNLISICHRCHNQIHGRKENSKWIVQTRT